MLTSQDIRNSLRKMKNRRRFDAALAQLLSGSEPPALRARARRALLDAVKDLAPLSPPNRMRPPRRADIRRLLAELRSDARTLRRRVVHFDELRYVYIDRIIRDFWSLEDYRRLLDQAGCRSADADPAVNESELCRFLFGVEALADHLLGEIPPDRGGRTDLEREVYGNPKMHLVAEAGMLFSEFRPDDIKTTVGGAFYRFAASLYELVTGGRDPEGEGVNLKHYVQFAAPRLRELAELNEERDVIFLSDTDRLSPEARANAERRFQDIRLRINEIWDELHSGPSVRVLPLSERSE